MSRPALSFAASLLLLTLRAVPASASSPLEDPAKLRFDDLGVKINKLFFSRSVALDDDGFLYYSGGSSGFVVQCRKPSDPAFVPKDLAFTISDPANGRLVYPLLGRAPSGKGILAIYPKANEWEIRTLVCSGAAPAAVSITKTVNPAVGKPFDGLTVNSAGQWCADFDDAIRCIDAQGKTVRTLDLATLKAVLPLDPRWKLQMSDDPGTGPTAPYENWQLDASLVTPDGRLFAMVEHRYTLTSSVSSTLTVRWIVQQDTAGGPLKVRLGPMLGDTGAAPCPSPLRGVRQLLFHQATNTVWAWPVTNFDPPDGLSIPRDPDSVGVRVLPLEGAGSGYLSFAADWRSRYSQTWGRGQIPLFYDDALIAPDGKFWLGVPSEKGGESHLGYHALSFDPAGLDLDLDGLTAGVEATLGTSDFLRDSDRGGASDGDEALRTGTSPTDGADDPIDPDLLSADKVIYTASPLLRMRFGQPTTEGDPWKVAAQGPVTDLRFPLCSAGTCFSRDGKAVGKFTSNGLLDAHLSADGTFLVELAGDTLVARVFGGAEIPLAKRSELGLTFTSAAGMPPLLAATLQEIYVTNGQQVVVFGAGKPPTLIYDHRQARCDAGLPCDRDHGTLKLLGYLAETGRLVVGTDEKFLLGLHATLPPQVLLRPLELSGAALAAQSALACSVQADANLPHWLLDDGHGDLILDESRRNRLFQTLPSTFNTFGTPPVRALGDGLVTTVGHAVGNSSAFELFEIVRTRQELEPGDALVVRPFSEGVRVGETTHFLRVGPRGGSANLIEGAAGDLAPTGASFSASGRLCLASPGRQQVIEFSPHADSRGVPSQITAQLDVGVAVDCGYDAEEKLHVLLASPSRIAIWGRHGEGDLTVRALGDPRNPMQLIVKPDGSEVVIYETADALGMGLSNSGGILRITKDALTLDDQPIGPGMDGWYQQVHDKSPNFQATTDGLLRIHLAERPDGLILGLLYTPAFAGRVQNAVVIDGELMVFDPAGKRTGLATSTGLNAYSRQALARKPGGAARDPWTDQPIDAASLERARPTDRPLFPVSSPSAPPSSCGGCGAQGQLASAPLLGLLALLRRRRVKR